MKAGKTRTRLDHLLVQEGLALTGAKARALIMTGRVRVDGQRLDKPGTRVSSSAQIDVAPPPHPYVSRGGVKLAGALDAFGIDPAGHSIIDVGASTGGFTDCLLQRGARRVIALDVGHGQLDWTLRTDDRVIVLEHFNARRLDPDSLVHATSMATAPEDVDLAVVDVSFISLALILSALATLPGLHRVLGLVKPQFEVGRASVGRGGIVRDPALHVDAMEQVAAAAAALGWGTAGVSPSPLAGAEGNREFFLHLVRPPCPQVAMPGTERREAIRRAAENAP
ncbi:MAG: TlyA family RNA methyltransferase [Acidobacteriota bacterium]